MVPCARVGTTRARDSTRWRSLLTTTRPFAIVTGASSGIGFELAKQFVQNGFDLIVCAEDQAIHHVAEALSAGAGRARAIQCDLATPDGVQTLWRATSDAGRPLAAIAINAGVGVGGAFVETSLEDELRIVALNCSGAVHLAKLAATEMVRRNDGKILITSSIAAVMPALFEAVYGATKAFLLSFSEALHNELGDRGVTVHRAGMDDTKVGQQEKDDPADVAKDGFEAMMAGKPKVVAGSFKNKLMAGATKVMSQEAAAAQHRKMTEPGSGHRGE